MFVCAFVRVPVHILILPVNDLYLFVDVFVCSFRGTLLVNKILLFVEIFVRTSTKIALAPVS